MEQMFASTLQLLKNWEFYAGALVAIIALAIIVPDRWALWLVSRKNVPTWVAPVAILALVVAFGNIIYAAGGAFIRSLRNVSIEPWVWWTLLAGAVVLAICVAIASRNNGRLLPSRRARVSEITLEE